MGVEGVELVGEGEVSGVVWGGVGWGWWVEYVGGESEALSAYVEFVGRDEVGGVRGIAEGGGDVEGRSYVRGAVEVVVGVDGLGRRG